jgi:cytochrome oxidase Cu insertion factor (SCO1/SenC/PrrC family)
MADKSGVKSKIKTLAILTILIGFPLLSWYYLKIGYNYQMAARAELKEYGELPAFNFSSHTSGVYSSDSLKNTMSVISFFGKDGKMNQDMFNVMRKLNTQFGDNRNLELVIVSIESELDSPNVLGGLFAVNQFDEQQHHFLTSSNVDVQKWIGEEIKVPTKWTKQEDAPTEITLEANKSGSIEEYPFFVLVDKNQMIRNFYHIDKVEEVKRMVEHIALLLPQVQKPDIEIREKKQL